nr:MAG TPA: hypothetical protein [Caudoviricetes sp.]
MYECVCFYVDIYVYILKSINPQIHKHTNA